MTAVVHLMKNSKANFEEPMGCPSRWKLFVSSTGIEVEGLVGVGMVKNLAIVLVMKFPNGLLAEVMAGSTAPHNCRVLQKKLRSGRYMHNEMSSS